MFYLFSSFSDELIKIAVGRPSMPPATRSPGLTQEQMAAAESTLTDPGYAGIRKKFQALKQRGVLSPTATYVKQGDQIIKLAQQEPGFPDPRVAEIAQRQQNEPKQKYLNKDVLKQFGKNTLAIGAGTAAGEGLATLTNMGLEAGAQRFGHKLPKALPHVVRGVTIPIMGAGSYMTYQAMRQRANEKLEEARQRAAAENGGGEQ